MPLIACNQALKGCLPCDDDPVRNLSAEDPDVDHFIGIGNWFLPPVPPNFKFQQTACKTVCYSTVSQEEADDCARRLAQECVDGPYPPGSPSPHATFFGNAAITETVQCPDGTSFSWTIPAGEFVALDQATANAIADSVARNRAIQHRICILSSSLGACINRHSVITIQAVGGTSLFFPFHIGPQTPLGFLDCHTGFQPIHYIWTIISGTLPAGLTLDECTGQITGTPTMTGSSTVTIRATDAIGSYQQKTIAVCVVQMGPNSLADGTVGVNYLQNLTETPGDQETENWALVSGALPDGLSLNSSGVISGTPTPAAGNKGFLFRVRVTVGSC